MQASSSLPNTFSLYSPPCYSLSSSRPTNFLALQHSNQHFFNAGKPVSNIGSSFLPLLNSYSRNANSIAVNDEYKNKRRYIFKASVSAEQESQPQKRDDEDGAGSNEFQVSKNKKQPSSLISLVQVYKKAILQGDEKTVYETEAMICMAEKEKNELVEKLSALSMEISSGKEKYIRLQADFDNFRKRSEKEKLTIRSDAQGDVIESLLPMVDSFERAKQHRKLETEREKKIDTSYQGIYKQFVEIMRSLCVAAVPTVGKPFDPSMHEAIAREESQEFKEGIIIQEFRRGFFLGDRLLRPAMVKVSSGPGKKKPSSVTERFSDQPASVAGVDER